MISIVTPSLNQARYLEPALRSVLMQDVELEYVVMDGGSTDGSVEIIERHADRLTAWKSERDDGQYDAINKGFALTSGEIMGWLNADDLYFPGGLSTVEDVFRQRPDIDWLTSTVAATANRHGQTHSTKAVPVFDRRAFFRGYNLPKPGAHSTYFVPQQATFWRRRLWDEVGGLDASLDLAGDFDLWARFYEHAELWGVRALVAALRAQPDQKSQRMYDAYIAEAEQVLLRHGGGRYSQREFALRRRLGRRLSNHRIWKLPKVVRAALEQQLVYSMRELIWVGSDGGWTETKTYFI